MSVVVVELGNPFNNAELYRLLSECGVVALVPLSTPDPIVGTFIVLTGISGVVQ